MLFANENEFQKAVRKYGIRKHKELNFKKNDKDSIRVVCNGKECCKWVVYAYAIDGYLASEDIQ